MSDDDKDLKDGEEGGEEKAKGPISDDVLEAFDEEIGVDEEETLEEEDEEDDFLGMMSTDGLDNF
jgi:hypothetical protein